MNYSLRGWKVLAGASTLAVAAFLPTTAAAAALGGSIAINGFCTPAPCAQGVTVTLNNIDFFAPVGPPNGMFIIGSATGDFLAGPFGNFVGSTGFAKDLNSANEPAGPGGFPLGGPIVNLPGEGNVLPAFFTFNLAGANVVFDLAKINLGIYSNAQCGGAGTAGEVCTPNATSPFNLANNFGGSSTVSLSVSGFVRRTDTNELSAFNGLYSATFEPCVGSNEPDCGFYQHYLPTLLAGGAVSNTYAGSFSAQITPLAVPEPASMALLGGGLIALGACVRRRRSRA